MAFQSQCILYILNRVSHRLFDSGMGGLVSRFVTPDQIRSVFRPIEKRLIDRVLCNWYFATWGIVVVVVVVHCLSRSHNYWWFVPVETTVGRCIYVFVSTREWATSPWGTTVYICIAVAISRCSPRSSGWYRVLRNFISILVFPVFDVICNPSVCWNRIYIWKLLTSVFWSSSMLFSHLFSWVITWYFLSLGDDNDDYDDDYNAIYLSINAWNTYEKWFW